MDVSIMLFAIMVLLLVALYVQLSRMIYEVRNLNILIRGISEQILGDSDHPDADVKHSLRQLIVKRSCGIEKEIVKIRHGLFGDGNGGKGNIPITSQEIRVPAKDQP